MCFGGRKDCANLTARKDGKYGRVALLANDLKETLSDFKTVRFRSVLGIVRNAGSIPALASYHIQSDENGIARMIWEVSMVDTQKWYVFVRVPFKLVYNYTARWRNGTTKNVFIGAESFPMCEYEWCPIEPRKQLGGKSHIGSIPILAATYWLMNEKWTDGFGLCCRPSIGYHKMENIAIAIGHIKHRYHKQGKGKLRFSSESPTTQLLVFKDDTFRLYDRQQRKTIIEGEMPSDTGFFMSILTHYNR